MHGIRMLPLGFFHGVPGTYVGLLGQRLAGTGVLGQAKERYPET